MANPRKIYKYNRIHAADVSGGADTSITIPTPTAQGYTNNGISPQIGYAIALTNTDQGLPQFGLGVSGDPCFGKLMSTDPDGTVTIQTHGYAYLPYNTSTPPVIGQPVMVDGTGKVQLASFTASGTNQTQTLTESGSPTGGTFTLSFNGQTTAAINYNDSAATIATRLAALSTIGSGNVAGSGGPLNSGAVTITFQGELAGQPVPLLVLASNSLTGGSSPTIAIASGTAGVEPTIAFSRNICVGFGTDEAPLGYLETPTTKALVLLG